MEMRPPALAGMPRALGRVTQLLKSTVCSRSASGVDSERWSMAAVSISAPPVSSTVTAIPRSTATSRISRARPTPPTRAVAVAAQRAAFPVGQAGLLHRVVEIAGRPEEAARLQRRPAAVGVGEEHDVLAHRGPHGGQALDVLVGVEADLHLDAPIA